MLDQTLLEVPQQLFQRLDLVWTFILLFVRYLSMMMLLPGISMGMRGLMVRVPATIALAIASVSTSRLAPVPADYVQVGWLIVAEILFGLVIGMIPYLIVSGAQMAGQLTSNTMGLAAGNLIDPSLGTGTTPLSLLMGDLVILTFLLLSGHHVAIYFAAGLGGAIPPGALLPIGSTAELLVDRSAYIFESGVILSAPVIVALLLTQFVMGLISKAVPTVNIFIVSFPLTIGIGLIITALSLPAFMLAVSKQITGVEGSLMVVCRAMMQ
ncbi:MAG: hypothetical protein GYA55_01590 [SAR324 cluster bacterium]|uniref:Flagellar biosynthetic protein FliR n=1 Tax=SAR324 cluster bacterium TaxID=2024889 RepID=A0A7X9IIQ1_9DELT|nr:hypothetical protein [SAR324 cluster bacterium]